MSIINAITGDLESIEYIASKAYRVYLDRMDKPPAPMLDDYAGLIHKEDVYVIEIEDTICGFLVLKRMESYVLLDNIAVHPDFQSRGLGKKLMGFAEDESMRMGYSEIQLYTHEKMVENYQFYLSLGWSEFKRQTGNGYPRIYMKKELK